jgi:predicted DNA-binding mobile mystery protein A
VSERTRKIARTQLDEQLALFPREPGVQPPRGGWVRAIRTALGMPQGFLAKRLGISRQSIEDLERSEGERRISLERLDRLAAALGCRVVYALVPESDSLEGLRERQARVLADAQLGVSAHSMALEAQGVSEGVRERQLEQMVAELLSGPASKLWR